MSTEPIARYYDETKNPDSGSLPGVPLGDIAEATFAAYPEWLQRSIDAHPMYRKTPARDTSKPPTKADKE